MTFEYEYPRYDSSGLADVVKVTVDPLLVALVNPPVAMCERAAGTLAFRHIIGLRRPLSVREAKE